MASRIPDEFLRAMSDATEALNEFTEATSGASDGVGESVGGRGEGGGGGRGGRGGAGALPNLLKIGAVSAAVGLGRKALVDSFNTSASFDTALAANTAESVVRLTGIGRNLLDPVNRAAERTKAELGQAAQFGELSPELIDAVQERNETLERNRQKALVQIEGNRLESVQENVLGGQTSLDIAREAALGPILTEILRAIQGQTTLLGTLLGGGGGAP